MAKKRRTPSFERPPVVEVALGVQFKEPVPLRIVHYGHLWGAYREAYPELQEHPPLPTVVESFGDEPKPTQQEAVAAAMMPRSLVRLWFSSPDQVGLVQVQADRFVFNWRKTPDDATYPRFDWVLDRFTEEWEKYQEILAELGIPSPEPDMFEVTYVNHIAAGSGWNDYADLHHVFPKLAFPTLSFDHAEPEEADVRMRFAMADAQGRSGRLHFRAFPARRDQDDTKLFVVNLVARGRISANNMGLVRQALTDGHDWVVLAFKDITSDAMHKIWGLEDGAS